MLSYLRSPSSALAASLILIIALQCTVTSAEELAYRWEPGQKFSYQVEVVVDSDTETTTYQGVIHYTVGNVNAGQATLTYRGGLAESKKYKSSNRGGFGPRGFGPPSIPSPFSRPTFRGKVQTTNKITITPRGQTLALEGDSQLPYLLGNVSLMPFEPLPEGDAKQWVDDGGVSITEKNNDDQHPFGRFGPMSPFARNESESVQAAGELSSYEVQNTEADLVTVNKSYRLNTPPTKDNPSFDMTGNGAWTFDTKENVPHAYHMKFNLAVQVKNTTTSIPITVKYNRISAAKLAEMEAAAKKQSEQMARAATEKKRIAETPLTAQQRQQALAALASGDANQIRETLDKLAAKSLKEPDSQIAKAIEPHLSSNDRIVSKSAHSAMTTWSPSYAKRKKLEKEYQGPGPVGSTGLVVESITPLSVGQIVQARRKNRGSFWYAAKVKKLLPDGKVELGFLTWGQERGRSTETVTRNNIQLAPPELVQAEKLTTMESPIATGARTWSDSTGRFKIDAVFVGVTDGKVTLRRTDGKTMRIPLEKLSSDDQALIKKLEDEKSAKDNPFQLVE